MESQRRIAGHGEYAAIASEAPERNAAVPGSAGQGMNLPNQLTLARVIMVPLFVLLLSIHHWLCYVLGYIVFAAAAITDYWDGKIARSRNLVTNFGKLLDPVADKVLLTAGFLMLMVLPAPHDKHVMSLHIPGWTVVAILAREFLVTGVRSLAASEGVVIAANKFGKAKAAIQMIYVFVFLFFAIAEQFVAWWLPEQAGFYRSGLVWSSYVAIVAVAVYTVYSGVQFMRINWRELHLGRLQ